MLNQLLSLIVCAQTAVYPSDIELMRQAVAEALKGVSIPEGMVEVSLIDESFSKEAWLVAEGLIQTLTDQEVEVFTGSGPEISWELRYRVTGITLLHQHLRRNWPWSQALVRRQARVEFGLKILKDQQLIAHFTLSGDSADVVPASQIPWLSSNEIPAQIISDAKIGLWEPLAVAMLAGVLIIVFYAPPTF